jgi:3-oxoacyl-[acyl-carrier-protein] synthase II
MTVVVTGIGLVSPLGDSPEALHDALCRGESGLAPVEGIETGDVSPPPVGQVRGFEPAAYLGRGNFRPLDRTGRMATAAASLALAAGGEGRPAPEDPRQAVPPREREIGLVLGTMFGSVRTIAEFDRRALTAGPQYVKPFDFANSVINAAAGQVAIWHDLRGVNETMSGGTVAGLQALGHAADLVAAGAADMLLAGGADELSFEAIVGFARCGLLAGSNGDRSSGASRPGHPVPYDARRNGFSPSEGAALVMMEREESAAARGATVLGRVLGHGAAFDPSRGRDEEAGAGAVARAVEAALAAAGLAPEDVACLSAGGSGSVALDRREAAGVARALGRRAESLPVTAVKSMLGEALGASGAFQAVTLLSAFRSGRLPGVAGLEELDGGCPLPGLLRETAEVPAGAGLAGLVGLATAADRHGGAYALLLAAP